MDFDDTDISFVNAFTDPEDISEIGGKLNGRISLDGDVMKPQLNGNLVVSDAQAKIEMLGVKYYLNGKIEVYEDLFALNAVPIKDEEGNTGSVIGSIFHENFQDWNFDVQVNFEDDYTTQQPNVKPLTQFLVLNTEHKDGDIYYGKAYGREVLISLDMPIICRLLSMLKQVKEPRLISLCTAFQRLRKILIL